MTAPEFSDEFQDPMQYAMEVQIPGVDLAYSAETEHALRLLVDARAIADHAKVVSIYERCNGKSQVLDAVHFAEDIFLAGIYAARMHRARVKVAKAEQILSMDMSHWLAKPGIADKAQ